MKKKTWKFTGYVRDGFGVWWSRYLRETSVVGDSVRKSRTSEHHNHVNVTITIGPVKSAKKKAR